LREIEFLAVVALCKTGQDGHYCYNPKLLNDYGTDAYKLYKPLLLCEGRCHDDTECGHGLFCSKGRYGIDEHAKPDACSIQDSYNSSASGGFCIYPQMQIDKRSVGGVTMRDQQRLLAGMCEVCFNHHRPNYGRNCKSHLVCTQNNPNGHVDIFDPFDFVPRCTAVNKLYHLIQDDKYCTVPRLTYVTGQLSLWPKNNCEGPCSVEKNDCLRGLVCQERHGNEQVEGCWSGRDNDAAFAMNYCAYPPLTRVTENLPGPVPVLHACQYLQNSPYSCIGSTKIAPEYGAIPECSGTTTEPGCSGPRCLKERPPVNNVGRNGVQKYSVEQRANGEPHCCSNFAHRTQPRYMQNGDGDFKPVGRGCVCSSTNPGFVYCKGKRGHRQGKDRM